MLNMTKLEEKLIELGYKRYRNGFHFKDLFSNKGNVVSIKIIIENNKIKDYSVYTWGDSEIRTQQDIDYKQQAFNELQKDLEVLKDIDKPSQKDIGNELWENDVKHMKKLGEWKRKQWNN